MLSRAHVIFWYKYELIWCSTKWEILISKWGRRRLRGARENSTPHLYLIQLISPCWLQWGSKGGGGSVSEGFHAHIHWQVTVTELSTWVSGAPAGQHEDSIANIPRHTEATITTSCVVLSGVELASYWGPLVAVCANSRLRSAKVLQSGITAWRAKWTMTCHSLQILLEFQSLGAILPSHTLKSISGQEQIAFGGQLPSADVAIYRTWHGMSRIMHLSTQTLQTHYLTSRRLLV